MATFTFSIYSHSLHRSTDVTAIIPAEKPASNTRIVSISSKRFIVNLRMVYMSFLIFYYTKHTGSCASICGFFILAPEMPQRV